jgi:hypothetical protein
MLCFVHARNRQIRRTHGHVKDNCTHANDVWQRKNQIWSEGKYKRFRITTTIDFSYGVIASVCEWVCLCCKNIFWYFHRPFNLGANSCKSLRGKACFLNSLLENAVVLLNSLRESLREFWPIYSFIFIPKSNLF